MNIKRLLTATVLICASTFAYAKKPTRPTPSVRFESFLGRGLLVHARVRGHEGTFLFDTGGGVTNITPEFAAATGCKVWGQISGFQMGGQRLDMQRCDNSTVDLGSLHATLETVGVFDVNKFMPPNAPHLDGTIALDALAGQKLAFSYSGHTLTLLNGRQLSSLTAAHTALPLHMVRDVEGVALTVNVPVRTPDGTAWFELDSGNSSPWVLVGKHLAGPLALDATKKTPQPLTGSLCDGSPFTADVRVMDLTLDGNLGTAFLAHYDVILDLSTAHAWVVPAA